MELSGASDAELLAATSSQPAAFAVFYDRYETAVVGYFAHRTADPEIAADLTSELFAAVLGAAGRYRPDSSTAAPWVFAIAHNILATSLRKKRVDSEARRRVGICQAARFAPDELERVEQIASNDRWILELLDRLPREQREAVHARVLDERPYAEIAGELQTSELVIRKRVSRGLSTLRAHLEKAS